MHDLLKTPAVKLSISEEELLDNNNKLLDKFARKRKNADEFLNNYISTNNPFNPNFKDSDGVPLIYYALAHQALGASPYRTLVEQGANPGVYFSIKDQSPTNLLITSAYLKSDLFFEILSNANIDINYKQGGKFSALRACMISGFNGALVALLDKGVNIDWDSCIEVHNSHQWPTFRTLLERTAPCPINCDGQNLIHILAQQKNFYKGMNYSLPLLSANNDINLKDNFGFTPLDYAIKIKNEEIIHELLINGADLFKLNHPNNEEHKLSPDVLSSLLDETFNKMKAYKYSYKDYTPSLTIFEKYKLGSAIESVVPTMSLSPAAFKV